MKFQVNSPCSLRVTARTRSGMRDGRKDEGRRQLPYPLRYLSFGDKKNWNKTIHDCSKLETLQQENVKTKDITQTCMVDSEIILRVRLHILRINLSKYVFKHVHQDGAFSIRNDQITKNPNLKWVILATYLQGVASCNLSLLAYGSKSCTLRVLCHWAQCSAKDYSEQ